MTWKQKNKNCMIKYMQNLKETIRILYNNGKNYGANQRNSPKIHFKRRWYKMFHR